MTVGFCDFDEHDPAIGAGVAVITRAADAPAGARYLWDTKVTLQAEAHILDDGKPEFISRCTPLRGYDGDDFPGFFIDVSSFKLSLTDSSTGREVFGVDRSSLTYFNQKNALFIDPEPFRLELGHSLYCSHQFKPLHKNDPAAGANSVFTRFNDDSRGRDDYFVQRNDFGASLTLRPSAVGHDGSQFGNIDLSYDRSDRESVRYFDYVTTTRLVAGTNPNAIRWRGVDQKLIEDVNRGGLGLSMSPFQWINVYYEISVEKCENTLGNGTLGSISGLPTAAADPARFANQTTRDQWQLNEVSLGFVPSTTKLINR